jgi:hypothetical protein
MNLKSTKWSKVMVINYFCRELFCKMVNKMNENFKLVFKFAHQPIYYSVFFQFSDIVSLTSIPRVIQNSKKTSLKNATKLNSESKCGQKISKFCFSKFNEIFQNILTEYFMLLLFFAFRRNFAPKKTLL